MEILGIYQLHAWFLEEHTVLGRRLRRKLKIHHGVEEELEEDFRSSKARKTFLLLAMSFDVHSKMSVANQLCVYIIHYSSSLSDPHIKQPTNVEVLTLVKHISLLCIAAVVCMHACMLGKLCQCIRLDRS